MKSSLFFKYLLKILYHNVTFIKTIIFRFSSAEYEISIAYQIWTSQKQRGHKKAEKVLYAIKYSYTSSKSLNSFPTVNVISPLSP